jgi:hypothetical protein
MMEGIHISETCTIHMPSLSINPFIVSILETISRSPTIEGLELILPIISTSPEYLQLLSFLGAITTSNK